MDGGDGETRVADALTNAIAYFNDPNTIKKVIIIRYSGLKL